MIITFSFQIGSILKIMKIDITRCTVLHVFIMFIQIFCSIGTGKRKAKHWFIGRTPPSIFEYPRINGFYPPRQAQSICEKDLQCGGFTFKGSKKIMHTIPEVYFFHFINESSSYLTTEIEYPHWTTYIVGSRDHIVVAGSYASHNCSGWRRWKRYRFFHNANI